MNAESIRDKTLEAYREGPDAVVELVIKLVAGLVAQLEGLSAQVVALEIENATFG